MRIKNRLSGPLSLTESALAVAFVVLASTGCGHGGGGGGDGGDGGSGDVTQINSSLNDSINSTFASVGGYQVPGDATVDETIVLDPPGSGTMALSPGMAFQSQVGFTAPPGVNVTGVGIRFGTSGPINVLPLAALSFHSRSGSGFAQQIAKRAKLERSRLPSPLRPSVGLDLGMGFPSGANTGSDSCDSIAASDQISGFASFPASTVGATDGTVASGICSNTSYGDIWFRWTAEVSGNVTFTTTGASDPEMDTILTVWPDSTGCPAAGTSLGCNDDYQASTFESQVSLAVTQGTSYLIQISNFLPPAFDPPWAGTLVIAADSSGGGGGGGSGGTGNLAFQIPADICSQLSSICHQIQCYEFAVTDAGTISRANIMDVAMQCGNCDEPSCQQLIQGCQGGGGGGASGGVTWFGSWNGSCGQNCSGQSPAGTFALYVDPNGQVDGVAVDPQGVSTIVTGSFDSSGNGAFGSAGGSSWTGSISGTGANQILSGTWTDSSDPSCPCNGTFSAVQDAGTTSFQGSYSGSWSGSCACGGSDSGSWNFTVDADGRLTGSYTGGSATNRSLFAIVISQTGTIIGGTPDEVVWLGQFNPSSGALIGGSVVDNTDPACLCAGTWQPN